MDVSRTRTTDSFFPIYLRTHILHLTYFRSLHITVFTLAFKHTHIL